METVSVPSRLVLARVFGFLLALMFHPLLPPASLLAETVQQVPGFPHARHEGLFPLCVGCHEGVETGVLDDLFPEPATCAGCHSGAGLVRVTWTGPTRQPSNLRFEHRIHAGGVSAAGVSALECAACHAPPAAPRMTVAPLQAERCLACHGNPPASHVVAAPCALCHEPLAESGLPLERIAALPLPSDHEMGRFVAELHGDMVAEGASRCSTCHTRERCLACHVDASRPELALVPAAPRGMELPPAAAHYPVPESHGSVHFEAEHGALVELAGPTGCATCHTRDDCASCHLTPLPEAVTALPLRASVLAPGATLLHAAPASHAVPAFLNAHGTVAASDPEACASCHTQPFCVECHNAPQQPEYHAPDYVQRHAADAWSRNSECAACHSVPVFCRSCHLESGFGAQGRLGAGFHDAEPLWLLRHGQAARLGLESCTSCHRQQDCLQCHSQLGAFRVNPHGPDFDARRAWERSPSTCLACHLQSPFGGGAP